MEGNEENGNGTPRFASAVRGYDRMQVDDYVERLHQWIEQADARAQQCEAAAARANAETEQFRRRLASVDAGSLTATPESLKSLGDRVEKIMQSSFQDAEEIRQRAEDAARATTTAAEAAATRVMEQATARAEELSRAAEELFVQAQEALTGAGAAAADQLDAARATANAEREKLVERALAEAREMDKRTRAEEAARREQLAVLEEHRRKVMGEIALLHERLGSISEGLSIPPPPVQDLVADEHEAAALPESTDGRADETMVLELPPGERPRRRKVASSAR